MKGRNGRLTTKQGCGTVRDVLLGVAIVGAAGAAVYVARDRVICFFKGHLPRRHPLGYFTCERCQKKGVTMGHFGFEGMLEKGRRWR